MGKSVADLVRLIHENPIRKDISVQEYDKIAIHYGFVLKRQKGSHKSYVHKDTGRLLVLAAHKKDVQPAYISDLRDAIDELDAESNESF